VPRFDDRFLSMATSQPQPEDRHFNHDRDGPDGKPAPGAPQRPFGITPEELVELNIARRSNLMNARADGILAVMLIGRAGWTPQSVAAFLGLTFESVKLWSETYQIGTIEDLRRLDPPAYTPIPPAEKA